MNRFDGYTTAQLLEMAERAWDEIMTTPTTSDYQQNQWHKAYDEIMEEIAIRSNEVTDESH